jgi:hypothetical protein
MGGGALAELAEQGITPEDVCRCCPWAIEYRAIDGSPCWRREDLAELLASGREDRQRAHQALSAIPRAVALRLLPGRCPSVRSANPPPAANSARNRRSSDTSAAPASILATRD